MIELWKVQTKLERESFTWLYIKKWYIFSSFLPFFWSLRLLILHQHIQLWFHSNPLRLSCTRRWIFAFFFFVLFSLPNKSHGHRTFLLAKRKSFVFSTLRWSRFCSFFFFPPSSNQLYFVSQHCSREVQRLIFLTFFFHGLGKMSNCFLYLRSKYFY